MPVDFIAVLELLDKELAKDTMADKIDILDVKLRLKDGTEINFYRGGLINRTGS